MSEPQSGPADDVPAKNTATYSEITLQQLRVLWAVWHAKTVSKAAKLLNLSQPTISQHLAKLEALVGVRLFDRRMARMVPTTEGMTLVQHALRVLREMQRLEEGLAGGAGWTRTLRIAGIGSMVRLLLPPALHEVQAAMPELAFDIHEGSPADVVEMLDARRVAVGLVAATALDGSGAGLLQVPLMNDPYVLVVPQALELDGVAALADLAPEQRQMLSRSVRFVFGSRSDTRMENWYRSRSLGQRVVAECRSFEAAVALVGAGLGICLAPAMSSGSDGNRLSGVRLYATELAAERPLVAVFLEEHRHDPAITALVEALRVVGTRCRHLAVGAVPPFLSAAAGGHSMSATTP